MTVGVGEQRGGRGGQGECEERIRHPGMCMWHVTAGHLRSWASVVASATWEWR